MPVPSVLCTFTRSRVDGPFRKLVREGFPALRLVLAHKPDPLVTHRYILAHMEARD